MNIFKYLIPANNSTIALADYNSKLTRFSKYVIAKYFADGNDGMGDSYLLCWCDESSKDPQEHEYHECHIYDTSIDTLLLIYAYEKGLITVWDFWHRYNNHGSCRDLEYLILQQQI